MNADRFKTLYDSSLALMEAIFQGQQAEALTNAARIRKELLDIRMQQIKENPDQQPEQTEEISQILAELGKLSEILNPKKILT